MKTFKDLDPLLHSQLRLAIVSLLVSEGEVDFNKVKQITKATSGNISIQVKKLKEAGYVDVVKTFKNNYQHTKLKITSRGIDAFEKYVEDIKQYLSAGNK